MLNEDLFGVTTDDQVLAACLREDGAVGRFAAEVNPLDVGYVHGVKGKHELYKAMLSYRAAMKMDTIDPVSWEGWLANETDLYEAIGGAPGFSDLMVRLNEVEIPPLDALIKMVEYRGNKRRRLDAAQNLQAAIANSDPSEPKDTEKISALAEEIKELYNELNYDPLEKIRTTEHIIAAIDDLWDIPPFLPTPFKNLNRAMGYTDEGGFFRGGVHAVLAMSGHGKSTLTKNLCNFWLDSGYTCLVVNFEEPEAHWNRILMTQMTGHNVYAEAQTLSSIEMSKISEEFKERIAGWGDRLMVRHDPDTVFFEDLEQWIRDIMGSGARQPDVVIIDTIQSMFKKTGGSARWGDYEYMMVRLEKLAKDMDAAFVITAQQNNNAVKEKREVFNQSDVGGGVTIAQKSTVAMFLTPLRGQEDEHDVVSDRIMEIQIPKNRITGTTFAGSPPYLRYDDNVKSYFEHDPSVSDERYTKEEVELDMDGY